MLITTTRLKGRADPGRHALIGKQPGFTLIELLITLSLIAILVTAAFPNFHNMHQKHASKSAMDTVKQAVSTAREMAITYQKPVVVCSPEPEDTNRCQESMVWDHGLIVFSDSNRNRQLDTEESSEVLFLRSYDKQNKGTITVNQSPYIVFNPLGHSSSMRRIHYLPHNEDIRYQSSLTLSITGRVKQHGGPYSY